jgi:hypothetical protein
VFPEILKNLLHFLNISSDSSKENPAIEKAYSCELIVISLNRQRFDGFAKAIIEPNIT